MGSKGGPRPRRPCVESEKRTAASEAVGEEAEWEDDDYAREQHEHESEDDEPRHSRVVALVDFVKDALGRHRLQRGGKQLGV